jgi:hypothetical protein
MIAFGPEANVGQRLTYYVTSHWRLPAVERKADIDIP